MSTATETGADDTPHGAPAPDPSTSLAPAGTTPDATVPVPRGNPGRDQAGDNADPWWSSTALAALRHLAASDQEFQAYDLVEFYGVPDPDHPNRWGALFSHAARLGLIRPVGAAVSRRPATAGSLTRTWRGTAGRRTP